MSPPNRVDPGWIHSAAADITLRLLQETVKRATDEEFNTGKIRDIEEVIPESTSEPAELLSRIFAHMGHHIPLVKRFEKRLEGRELKSGIASDLLALLVQIYGRNKHLIPVLIDIVNRAKNQAQERQTQAKSSVSPNGETIVAPPGFFDEKAASEVS